MSGDGTRESFRSAISAASTKGKPSRISRLGYAAAGRPLVTEVSAKVQRDRNKGTKETLRSTGWSTLGEFARIYAGESGKTEAAIRGHLTRLSLNIVREKQESNKEYSTTHMKKIGQEQWWSPEHLQLLRDTLSTYFS